MSYQLLEITTTGMKVYMETIAMVYISETIDALKKLCPERHFIWAYKNHVKIEG